MPSAFARSALCRSAVILLEGAGSPMHRSGSIVTDMASTAATPPAKDKVKVKVLSTSG